jgi:hypothetical protein
LALERGEIRFTVVFGTKGHRPRETIQDAGAGKKVPENAWLSQNNVTAD